MDKPDIVWVEDKNPSLKSIRPFDMYTNGRRAHAWICYYVRDKKWCFKGASVAEQYPVRATREEAEADAFAWWVAKELERMT